MVFSSLLFIFIYLAFVLALYYLLPRRYRNAFLFFANILFYGYGEPVYILLMFFSITFNYVCGLLLDKYRPGKKVIKGILIGSVVVNLGLLGVFKYTGFICQTLKLLPIFGGIQVPSIVLPIGISFYTFQTMSYTIDVYYGRCAAQKNYVTFGTYVALFPQLIAGPIVRYVDVADQMENRRENWAQFTCGVKLFMIGLAKKVLLANQFGKLWGILREQPGANGILGSWVGILAFTMQIYFDFSGYSDMARGLGNMFGFSFLKNFDYPYISKSITEFWRRWHISLGTWFREYVYIPLGGNRRGPARQYLNLFVVWFLTGLWHGASWNFVIWGLYFCVLLVLEKTVLLRLLKKGPPAIAHLYTMFFVVLGWVIFDFTDLGAMGRYFASLFSAAGGWIGASAGGYILAYLPLLLVGAVACLPLGRKLYDKVCSCRMIWLPETVICIGVLLLCVAALVSDSYNPFLYFRF